MCFEVGELMESLAGEVRHEYLLFIIGLYLTETVSLFYTWKFTDLSSLFYIFSWFPKVKEMLFYFLYRVYNSDVYG